MLNLVSIYMYLQLYKLFKITWVSIFWHTVYMDFVVPCL